jgi:multiple sugar transport system substrate-binding protein
MKSFLKSGLIATTALMSVASGARAADVTLAYWMWDGNQSPVYRQCADKFEAANPGIKIKITQDGWDNYWTTLTTGFVSGSAPDVFVNHLSRFPEFLANGVMVDVTDRIAKDKVDMKAYLPGLAESWNKDGKQWGLPKDWDTIALVYNKKMLADAGVTEDELRNADWNPDNGGSFEKILAKLTVDGSGKHGGEAGFDKAKVATYAWATNPIDGYGQNQWSFLAASAGFKAIDKPWGTKYAYDSAPLVKTLTWLRDLGLQKGYAISEQNIGKLNASALFSAGKVAIVPDGSWMISSYRDTTKFEFGFAPLPKGPEGRKSMFNGLADSIWTGSKHPDEAWKWVKYLGSAECQAIVGNAGVVFPARPEAAKLAEAAHKAKGFDVSAFTMLATPETTFPFPISDHGNEISAILRTALQNVMLNKGDPAKILKAANDEVNGMF